MSYGEAGRSETQIEMASDDEILEYHEKQSDRLRAKVKRKARKVREHIEEQMEEPEKRSYCCRYLLITVSAILFIGTFNHALAGLSTYY